MATSCMLIAFASVVGSFFGGSAWQQPQIVPRFTADIVPDGHAHKAAGRFVYDRIRRATRTDSTSFATAVYGSSFKSNLTTFRWADESLEVLNGQCRHNPKAPPFHDPLAFLSHAVYVGQHVVLGQSCWLWKAVTPMGPATACILNGTLVQLTHMVPGWLGTPTWENLTLRNFTPVVNQHDFEAPASCRNGTAHACPHKKHAAEKTDVYVFHPAGDYNISGQDVADLMGEVSFICGDLLMGGHASAAYGSVSRWALTLWNNWGQYAMCNDAVPGQQNTSWCVGGGPGFLVGHAAAWGAAPFSGQCQSNLDTGEWYSLPQLGRCQKKSQKLGRDCTWRVKVRVATASRECLFHDGSLMRACMADVGLLPPFRHASAMFERVFHTCVGETLNIII